MSWYRRAPTGILVVFAALSMALAAQGISPAPGLGRPEPVAPGIDLFRLDDASLLSPPGPVAVQLLRLDPRRIILRSALAMDRVIGLEEVANTSARHRAIAAINAGFFLPSGDPAGLLEIGHDLISESLVPKGAVAIADTGNAVSLLFDRLSVTPRLVIGEGQGVRRVDVDGINTARPAGKLVWFSPRFFDHTDTTEAGIEWVLCGTPLHVVERRDVAMRTRIPGDGAILSFGGAQPPPVLAGLTPGTRVGLQTDLVSDFGTPASAFAAAQDIVGGAGLLVHEGKVIADWKVERLREGFDTERHPRTIIGRDEGGRIWLITVDGRNDTISLGMRFAELQRLALRVGLRDGLNLDGGGSTTMVVRGKIVNHPSDKTGPRKVSDSLLVFAR
jgi:hypothetical protein